MIRFGRRMVLFPGQHDPRSARAGSSACRCVKLTDRMIRLDDLEDRSLNRLAPQLGNERDWTGGSPSRRLFVSRSIPSVESPLALYGLGLIRPSPPMAAASRGTDSPNASAGAASTCSGAVPGGNRPWAQRQSRALPAQMGAAGKWPRRAPAHRLGGHRGRLRYADSEPLFIREFPGILGQSPQPGWRPPECRGNFLQSARAHAAFHDGMSSCSKEIAMTQ